MYNVVLCSYFSEGQFIMCDTFKKIQRKILYDTIVKSILLGLSAGALVAGCLLLASKLLEKQLALPSYIAFGFGAFAIVTAVAFLLMHKKETQLAQRLDEKYSLREKVATMVAFQSDTSDMAALQREQTENILQKLPIKQSVCKRFGVCALIFVLTCAIMVTGIVIPAKTTEVAPVPEIPFQISQWQLGALELLIEEVKCADVDAGMKNEFVTELQRLLAVLKETKTQRKMRDEVIASIVAVDLIAENTNTYKKICIALDGGENPELKKVAAAVLALNGIGFSERLGEFRDVFTGDHCMIQVNAFSAEANTLLPNAGVPTDNALYTALAGYFADMTAISTSGETNQNAIQAQLDKAFSSAADNVGTALSAQYANKSLRDRVISKLIEIFQIPPEEIPSLLGDILPKLSDAGAADDSKDNESENTGGYGSGENLFGSNDIIYHPFGEGGGAYIEYGYALDEYYKKIEELLLEGNLSEETKKIIIDYFARLSNGTKDN